MGEYKWGFKMVQQQYSNKALIMKKKGDKKI